MTKERKSLTSDKHSAEEMADGFFKPLAGFRLGFISLLAALVGILAGLIAYVLYDLIGLFTNLAYYHEWSFHFRSPENTHLGLWIIVTPVIGGLIVGFMAKFGSEKSKGMEFRRRWKRC
jgi:H+/Cl- antiporter ClcA